MATATEREEALKRRIKELEDELSALKRDGPQRRKIEKMTGEVVDSNPYRRVKKGAHIYDRFHSKAIKTSVDTVGSG